MLAEKSLTRPRFMGCSPVRSATARTAIGAEGEGATAHPRIPAAGERPSRFSRRKSARSRQARGPNRCGRKSFAVGAPGHRSEPRQPVLHGKRHFARLDVVDPQQSILSAGQQRFPSGLNATERAYLWGVDKVGSFGLRRCPRP